MILTRTLLDSPATRSGSGLARPISIFLAIVIGLSASPLPVKAQIPRDDLALLRGLLQPRDSSRVVAPSPPFSVGAREGVALLVLYRTVFSSRDASSCQFYPSCSHFAEEAIRTRGVISGCLLASDRLQRCHPRASHYYPVDLTRHKLIDPVSDHTVSLGESAGSRADLGHFRSPAAAMALSTVMPGAGQVYAGRFWDGFFSSLQCLAFGTFAFLDFRREGARSARGWTLDLLGAGFYAGNVAGAGDAARLYNRRGRIPSLYPVGRNPPPLQTPAEDRLRKTLAHCDSLAALERPEARSTLRYEAAMTAFAAGAYGESLVRFDRLARNQAGTDLGNRALYFRSLCFLQASDWDEAKAGTDSLLACARERPDSIALRKASDCLARPRACLSPAKAKILSAVVPGLGQAYAHSAGRALAAFGLDVFLGYYARNCWRTHSFGELALFAGPTFWRYYRGNIKEAGRTAADWDRRQDGRLRSQVMMSLGVSFPLAREPAATGG